MSKRVKESDIKNGIGAFLEDGIVSDGRKEAEEKVVHVYYGYLTLLTDDYKIHRIINEDSTTAFVGYSYNDVEEQIAKKILEYYECSEKSPGLLKSHLFDKNGKYIEDSLEDVETAIKDPEYMEKGFYFDFDSKPMTLSKLEF